jgi:hypothetical protein
MLLLISQLVQPVLADAPVVVEAPADAAGGNRSSGGTKSDGKGDGKGGDGKSNDSASAVDDGGFLGSKKKWLKWWWQPYVQPGGGVQIDTSGGDLSATVGVTVGTKYWKKKWQGDLHLGGSYIIGTGGGDSLTGYELELGNDFGRREKYWGAQIGLSGLYSGYSTVDGATVLDPSVGLGIPVELTVGPRKYYVYGGIAPAFYLNPDRQRGAYGKNDPLPLFGDELSWTVGLGLNLTWVDAELLGGRHGGHADGVRGLEPLIAA